MATFPTSINALTQVLEKRHLTAAEGLMLGISVVSPQDASSDLGFTPGGQIKHMERLPYYDLDGSPLKDPKLNIPFVRYRVDRPTGWTPPIDKDGNPIKMAKYMSPRGSSTFVYLPRVEGINWELVASDPTVDIMITEGEFKAVAVCKLGIPCIGLGGVGMFGGSGEPFPPPMDRFSLLGRKIDIVFDADKESDYENPLKKPVASQATRLASKLFLLGAVPSLLSLARTDAFKKARASDPNAKMGIDDFIEAGGTPEDLIATRTNPIECADMAELTATYAYYCGEGPHVVNIKTGEVYKTNAFIHELEVNRKRLQERKNAPPRIVYVAKEFIESRDRPEIDKKVFWPHYKMGYDPDSKIYNEWRGFAVEGRVGEDAGSRERYNEVVAIWKRYIEGLFGDYAWYFEKWLAHLFQRPGEKTTIAVILASPLNGVGKSLLGEIIRGMIGWESSVAIELDRAMKNFNAPLARKVFLQMDEAEGKFSGHESKLNDLISSDQVMIERKGFDPLPIDNFARVYLTSNSVAPVRIYEENRRLFICVPDMTTEYARKEWAPWVGGVVAKRLKGGEGAAMLRWHLDRVDLTGWDPCARVVATPAMLEMVEASRTKNGDVMDGLWEAFIDEEQNKEGWWVLTGELRKKDSIIWSNLIAKLKAEGGQTLAHQFKVKGKASPQKCVILDRSGKMAKHRPNGEDKYWLNNASEGLTGEQCTAAERRASVAYVTWKGIVLPSDKY